MFIFNFFVFHYLSFNYFFNIFFWSLKKNSLALFGFFLVWLHLTLFYFLFVGEGAFVSDDFSEYTFEDSDDWDKLGSFLALVEFEG
jgi:hypothetical protein